MNDGNESSLFQEPIDDEKSLVSLAGIPPSHHHVEIAMLSMPSTAAESGVQSGDGTNFVLEAPSFVIDQLVESDQLSHSYDQGSASSPPIQAPCIEGVVDLDMVSHLVNGVSEQELVNLLHKDMGQGHHEHPHSQHEAAPMSIMAPVDENQPMQDGSPGAGHFRISTKGELDMEMIMGRDFRQSTLSKENQPLLRNSSSHDSETACLTLSADPFVQTINEVHQQSHQQTKDSNDIISTDENQHITVVDTIETSDLKDSFLSYPHNQTGEVGGKEVAVSREAFLISIPSQTTHGDIIGSYNSGSAATGGTGVPRESGIFVLAMPEMIKESTEQAASQHTGKLEAATTTNILRSSATKAANSITALARDEIHPLINQAFHPLPTDVQHIELRVSTVPGRLETDPIPQQEIHLDVIVDRQVPLVGYIILISGLVSLASIGAALDLQNGATPIMKSFWRFSATTVLFSLLASKSFTREEFSKFSPIELFVWIPFAAMNYAFLCSAFVIALEMTSLVNAFILSNMASLIIIGSKFALGAPVLFYEGLGALIGFIGALICASASPAADGGDEDEDGSNLEMIGNLLAFMASIATALYLSVAKVLRPKVDLFLFMFLIFLLSSVSTLVYMTCTGEDYEFSTNPETGLFGWLNLQMDRLPLELFMAIICNGVGTAGYIAVMKYFDPVVVTMTMLSEPIIASFIGAAVGVSSLPGWKTWAGDAVVAIGSAMVISSGSRKTESIDATEALHSVEREIEDYNQVVGSTKSSMTMKSLITLSKGSIKTHNKQIVRDKDDESVEEMEFISVSGRHRALTASSVGGGDVTVIWN